MTKEKKPLQWIMDKENKYYFSEISARENPFRNRYIAPIWSIIYLIITFVLYYLTNKKNKYTKYEFKGLIFGIISSMCIFVFYYFIDFHKSFTYLDQKYNLYLEEPTTLGLIDPDRLDARMRENEILADVVITENNHYFSGKYNKETDFLAVPRENIKKEIKNNKIKVESLIDWSKKDNKKLALARGKMIPITDKQFEKTTSHMSRMISILLTLSFLLAATSKTIFKKWGLWIFTVIAIEVCVGVPIWTTVDTQQDRNALYIMRKIQLITSCLAITILTILLETFNSGA